jgi:cell division protein FtsW
MRRETQRSSPAITRRHRPDYHIVLYMGLLMLLGLIIMYAIGPQRANVLNNAYGTDYYTSTYFFIKQSLSLAVALAVFVLMAVVPYTYIQRYATKILLVGFGACIVLAAAGFIGLSIAQCSLGACRWFNLGPLGSFQPAEVLKFGIVAFMSGFLSLRMRQGRINDIDKTIIPLAVVTGTALLFIVVIQKDLGTGISLAAILGSMLLVSGISARVGGILITAAIILGLLFVVMAPHRRDRILTYLRGDTSTSSSANGSDYQVKHAKIAIGSGGFLGVGIGNSVQATGYLPEAINDSVFAVMGETFGFVGLTVIIGLFTALLLRLLRATEHLQDPWMRLAVAGVFGWLGAHVILNVASMIGIVPLTGITLPLLSFGGTSMIFIAGALGLAFQLSRYTVHGSINKEATGYENSGSRRGIGRTRYASRRSATRM